MKLVVLGAGGGLGRNAVIGHLWTHPILLDGARYASRYGPPPLTPLPAALAATIAWLRTAKDVRLQG